jgi:aspartate dehydrogenase
MHLGIIGLGNIGRSLLAQLQGDLAPSRVTALLRAGSATLLPGSPAPDIVHSAADLVVLRPDLVVECAGHTAVRDAALPCLRAGIDVVIVSVGALADEALDRSLRQAAREGGARIILPPGAIGGIDLLSALAAAGDCSVSYTGTKPPAAWRGSAAESVLELDRLEVAQAFFTGSAREAALAYPKNANVAATLALAGAGLDATRVRLVADPAATGNRHAYSVTSPLGDFTIEIENRPSPDNPRTSAATVLSVMRCIRNRLGPVEI